MDESRVLTTSKIRKAVRFALQPDPADREAIATRFALIALRKFTFEGQVSPEAKADFVLTARLGATVVQPCVVTGDPVTTRIETDVVRRYLADMPEPEGDEIEMPEDETAEPLSATIDLTAVMEEALALALPDFPRSDGADAVDITVTAPGVAPMTDDDAKPFAGLKALRDRMAGDGEDGPA